MEIEPSTQYGSWTGDQLESFLWESRIPLRLSIASDAGPIIVPVWFEYQKGCFLSCSPDSSLLVQTLRKRPEVAFDVSTNDVPYRGVRGRGSAVCTITPDSVALTNLLQRYLGTSSSEFSQRLLRRTDAEALVRVDITSITSWDFSARMQSGE